MRRLLSALLAPALMVSGAFAQAEPPDPATLAALLGAGQPIFEANCAACHSKTGGGLVGPSFHGNDRIANSAFVIRQISQGSEDMPAFRSRLTAEEILAVGTYIRNSWGKAYGILAEEPAQ